MGVKQFGKDLSIRKSTDYLPHRDLRSNFQGCIWGGNGRLEDVELSNFFSALRLGVSPTPELLAISAKAKYLIYFFYFELKGEFEWIEMDFSGFKPI